MFEELADTSSPYFSRRVKLLETVAKLEFCVLMIDTGSEDLILKMFTVFYDVVRFSFSFIPLYPILSSYISIDFCLMLLFCIEKL